MKKTDFNYKCLYNESKIIELDENLLKLQLNQEKLIASRIYTLRSIILFAMSPLFIPGSPVTKELSTKKDKKWLFPSRFFVKGLILSLENSF